MKIAKLRKRLRPNRPMTTISMRVPQDVIEDLKRLAPLLGFSGYQPLIRAYIGQGLRSDAARLEQRPDLSSFVQSLRKHGVSHRVIKSAVAEARALRRVSGLTKRWSGPAGKRSATASVRGRGPLIARSLGGLS